MGDCSAQGYQCKRRRNAPRSSEDNLMEPGSKVLYVYRCAACGHHGKIHFEDDSHDGEAGTCSICRVPVIFEWDGGVTFEVKAGLATPRAPDETGV
jgi:hypothetical protein